MNVDNFHDLTVTFRSAWLVHYSIMTEITWPRFDQSTEQLFRIIGRTTTRKWKRAQAADILHAVRRSRPTTSLCTCISTRVSHEISSCARGKCARHRRVISAAHAQTGAWWVGSSYGGNEDVLSLSALTIHVYGWIYGVSSSLRTCSTGVVCLVSRVRPRPTGIKFY